MTELPSVMAAYFKDSVFLVTGLSHGARVRAAPGADLDRCALQLADRVGDAIFSLLTAHFSLYLSLSLFCSRAQGILAFMCSPLVGALSDWKGRKAFLLAAVIATTAPIPTLFVDDLRVYMVVFVLTGVLTVTFSVGFAYVADITTDSERGAAYGRISAMFAASLVTSPFLGSQFVGQYGRQALYGLSCGVALLDVLYILAVVPESLPERRRPKSLDLRQSDPFTSLCAVGRSRTMRRLSLVVLLRHAASPRASGSSFRTRAGPVPGRY